MTRRGRLSVAMVIVSGFLGACSTTRVTTTWTAPGVRRIAFEKIVVFVLAKDEAVRRNGEHELCEQITRVPCVPAFAVVPDDERGDVEAVRRRVEVAGFDGAVVLRLSDRRVQQTYVPPSPAPLWGYYGYGWGMAYDPGHVRQDEVVDVETAVYAVADRRLLWVGTTESMNPRDVRKTIAEIVAAVGKEMRKQGVLDAPAS